MKNKKIWLLCAVLLSGCSSDKIELLTTAAETQAVIQTEETKVTAADTTKEEKITTEAPPVTTENIAISTEETTADNTEATENTTEQITETDPPLETATEDITEPVKAKLYLERDDWAVDVKQAVNDLADVCASSAETEYAVFDFDNTCAIFDVESQTLIYTLNNMTISMTPQQLKTVLGTGLNVEKSLETVGIYCSYEEYIDDIVSAYQKLIDTYGSFSYKGISEDRTDELHSDIYWQEYATKMRTLWNIVWSLENNDVASPWAEYWFYGMTYEEVYDIAFRSHSYYSKVETSLETWTSPDIASNAGRATCSWICGVSVTPNIAELMRVLTAAGVDVYICSASMEPVIAAAVDYWGLADYVKGILAMTISRDDSGRYINSYDYSSAVGTQTAGSGKVKAVDNVLVSRYGVGPVAGFMDSTGDFNFCTEYSSLKLVVIFNRANRSIKDGGGLLAEIAIYERDYLGLNLNLANASGDTLYVLQGRNENGLRSLISSNSTIVYGSADYKLFAGDENVTQISAMSSQGMSVKTAIDTFAIKGDGYGFLDNYSGYHSR